MKTTKLWTTLVFAAALLTLVGVAPATAEACEEDESCFKFWVEPVDLWILETDRRTDSAKFDEYRDLSSGLWAGIKLYGAGDGGNRNLALRLAGIGREDARYRLDYRVEGKYALAVDYNKIPHRFGNNATLIWDNPEINRFEFPDPVQEMVLDAILAHRAAGNRVNFDFLEPLLAPYYETANRIDLALRRDRTDVRFDLGAMGKLAWSFGYSHENREGNRPMGAAFGFNNVQEIPEPIRYDTTGAEISGELNGEKGGLRFGYRYSQFENALADVTWDNIFRSFDSTNGIAYLGPNTTPEGPSQGQASLPPDNDSTQLFLDGRARAGGWWFSGSLSLTSMNQDEPLLPFGANTAIVGTDERTGLTFDASTRAGVPINTAGREVDVMTLSGNAGTDLGEDWSLRLRYRTYDYDNKAPRTEFPGYVRLDAVWEPFALLTVPYDFTKDIFGLEVAWDASDATIVTFAYQLESWDRTFREIETSDEDTFEVSVDSRPNDKVTVRASWATGDRSTSHYDVEAQEVFFVNPPGINNQPALRKFDEAVRDVDDYDFSVQYFPQPDWNFSFGVSARQEDYPDSVFGLVADDFMNYNFEIGYAPGANLNVYLFAHNEDREVFQRARQSGGTLSTNPLDDWSLGLNEDTDTLGFGINSETDSGWSWDLSANLSDTDGEGDFRTPDGGRPVEDIDNYEDIELLSIWLNASYELNESAKVGVFYYYEDYSINSFILQGVVPYLPQSILLAGSNGDYRGNIFGLNLRVMF